MDKKKIIQKLQDDTEYYGEFGKQFLSASNIRQLLYEPTKFNETIKTLPLLEGRYFHTKILEPEKIDTIPIFNSASRNTNAFKSYLVDQFMDTYDVLLEKEKNKLDDLVDKLLENYIVFDLIYGNKTQYEVPNIKEIYGQMFKGKCDVLVQHAFEITVEDRQGNTQVWEYPNGAVVDLKTSSDIQKFRHSSMTYCFDSQAYIYQQLFDKPMLFIAIDKKLGTIKFSPCSEEFIFSGESKVKQAIKIYEKFFSDHATHDLNNYIYTEVL